MDEQEELDWGQGQDDDRLESSASSDQAEQEDDEHEEDVPSKKRMRDFVGAPVCSKCGALFSEDARFRVHTATLYKTDCSVCRAATYKKAADLVVNQSADAMDAAAAAVGAGRKKRKLERKPPSHHEDLLDAVGSLQRFRQARTFKASSYGNRKSSEEKLSSSAAAAIHGNLESSAERPVEMFMTAHPGDDKTYESWLHTFGLEKKIVQHMLKSRKRSSNSIPWSTSLRVADHPELFPLAPRTLLGNLHAHFTGILLTALGGLVLYSAAARNRPWVSSPLTLPAPIPAVPMAVTNATATGKPNPMVPMPDASSTDPQP
jgi:hypothetical protein